MRLAEVTRLTDLYVLHYFIVVYLYVAISLYCFQIIIHSNFCMSMSELWCQNYVLN